MAVLGYRRSGQVAHTGITQRRPTVAQRRHVQARNPTCVFPGCRMPSRNCDVDHTVAVIDGGPTTTCNLAPLCRHHQRPLSLEQGYPPSVFTSLYFE
jgi:hypothetical protein